MHAFLEKPAVTPTCPYCGAARRRCRRASREGPEAPRLHAAQITNIKNAYRLLYRSGAKLADATAQLHAQSASQPELKPFVDFLSNSERGIVR